MPKYFFNDGQFEAPEDWEDKTVVALSFPLGAAQPKASLTITRELMLEEIELAEYIDKQLVHLARTFTKYNLLRRKEIVVDKEPAVVLEFTWRTPDKIFVHQEQTILKHPSKSFIITITATTQKGSYEKFTQLFQKIVKSFSFK